MVAPPSPPPASSVSTPPDLEGPVVNPTDQDVRLGRGRGCTNHFGNTLMEDLIKTYSEQYANASKIIGIKGKKLVSTSIVQAIHRHGGRFIKHCPERDVWIQVPEAVARVKVAQALKYRCRKLNVLLRSQEGESTKTVEEQAARSSSSMLTQITAAATMELLRSSCEAQRRLPPAPPPTAPSTPQSVRRTTLASAFVSSPPARARTTAVAVTPYSPPLQRRVVDFRYYFPVPLTRYPAEVDPSPVASMTREPRQAVPPVMGDVEDEDDAISISSLGNDAYVAESLNTLIQDYIAVPPLSSNEEESRPLPVLETPPRPNALQRSTALSAKVLHDDEDPDDPLSVLDK